MLGLNFLSKINIVIPIVIACGVLFEIHYVAAEPLIKDKEKPLTQNPKAIALANELAEEMDDYFYRHGTFRHTLREKYPRGEERIAALEKWRSDHSEWHANWEKRKQYLDSIWNWGAEGKPAVPKKFEDLTTASGKMAAALRKIRSENKGTGKTGNKIAKWKAKNKALLNQEEVEQIIPTAPPVINSRPLTGTPEEVELELAKRELKRIRQELINQGADQLKAAMRNPYSAYSQQKKILSDKTDILQKAHSQIETESKTRK